jgi:Tol biopolymer transport system component
LSQCSIDFLDLATHRTTKIAPLEHDPTSNPGLNLSPDGQWLIYSMDDYRSLDIMLVENFR